MGATAGMPLWVLPLVAWSAVWKLIALWKAARRSQLAWYVALAILNTAGILEIIYIYAVAPRHPEPGQQGPAEAVTS